MKKSKKYLLVIAMSFTTFTAQAQNLNGLVGDAGFEDFELSEQLQTQNQLDRSFDAAIAAGLPRAAAEKAFSFFENVRKSLTNQKYLTMINFTTRSNRPRMFVIDVEKAEVKTLLTAHGRNSDVDHDGYATKFSNIPQSKQSSLGFFATAERYYGKHGLSMRLDGLEKRNDKARPRAIVIHGAKYVNPKRGIIGRSWGCPSVENGLISTVVNQLEEGSLMYSFHEDYTL